MEGLEERKPRMPKATAVWLLDNTILTFKQIAEFVGLHELEISGIADGDVSTGIKGSDPIAAKQLTRDEITRCEKDPEASLELSQSVLSTPANAPPRQARFIPVAIRQNRPSAIAWLLRYHPELSDNQIGKLVGTTKSTIDSVRNRTHWNIRNLKPTDPVVLGLCKQIELDAAVAKAGRRKARSPDRVALSNEERRNLMSSDEALSLPKEPLRPVKTFKGLENFSLTQPRAENSEEGEERQPASPPPAPAPVEDPEQIFNLPSGDSGS